MIFGPSLLGAALAWALLNQMERTSRVDGALRRTEERFELAVSGAKCGIWDWDIANKRLYWSGAMNALLGRGKQPRVLTLDEAQELIHPDDRFVLTAIESSVRSGADGYDRSFRAKHADGHWVWMRAKGQHYRTLRSDSRHLRSKARRRTRRCCRARPRSRVRKRGRSVRSLGPRRSTHRLQQTFPGLLRNRRRPPG
jgi:two-component system cell cycle sensor histidine kinase PleC